MSLTVDPILATEALSGGASLAAGVLNRPLKQIQDYLNSFVDHAGGITKFIPDGSTERMRLTSDGCLAIGTTYTTGTGAAKILLPNGAYIYWANPGGNGWMASIGCNSAGQISLGTVLLNLGNGTGLVTAGDSNSGGSGYRLLRIPN